MSYNKNSYNGLMMLLMQAAMSEDIWLNKKYNIDYKKIYNEIKKVICCE
jgi:shikimate 5-dehydrogenase